MLLGFTLAVGILTFVVSLAALVFMGDSAIDENIGEMHNMRLVSPIPAFDIEYAMGMMELVFHWFYHHWCEYSGDSG